MKLLITTIALAITLTGCAGTLMQPVQITTDDRAQFEASGPVTVSMQVTPGIMFNTPTGAVVDYAMWSFKDPADAPSWKKVSAEHDVADLTETVRDKFIADLSNRSALLLSPVDERQPYSTKEETAYVRQYPTDYVLEVRSQYGSFHYGPLSWKTYFLNYSGQARLIRTADEVVVWKETCQVKAKESDVLQVPYDDFFGGNGEKLRAAAAHATDSCVAQLSASYASTL